jgi:Zn finger protein HypA/HybF involved in hydrogenase expression
VNGKYIEAEDFVKRGIEYNSETILPKEVMEILDECQVLVMEYKNEPDKQQIMLDIMRRKLMSWFEAHEIKYEKRKYVMECTKCKEIYKNWCKFMFCEKCGERLKDIGVEDT